MVGADRQNKSTHYFQEVLREELGADSSGRKEYYSMSASVDRIRTEKGLYKGCPNVIEGERTCNKKVVPCSLSSFDLVTLLHKH